MAFYPRSDAHTRACRHMHMHMRMHMHMHMRMHIVCRGAWRRRAPRSSQAAAVPWSTRQGPSPLRAAAARPPVEGGAACAGRLGVGGARRCGRGRARGRARGRGLENEAESWPLALRLFKASAAVRGPGRLPWSRLGAATCLLSVCSAHSAFTRSVYSAYTVHAQCMPSADVCTAHPLRSRQGAMVRAAC